MQSVILFFLVFINSVFCSYSDAEIEDLLMVLSNPSNPSLEDYRKIEHYFEYGERPYLAMMKKNTHVSEREFDFRISQLRNFKLVGPNGEMPILQLFASNVTEDTKDRCILIYGSYNPHYPGRVLRLAEELKECGYSGYIMLRIGGIPDLSHGGARLCMIPYTWRVHLFKEAVRQGFTKILYLDASLHPLTDLAAAFDVIDDYGLFSCTTGGWPCDEFADYIRYVGIPVERRYEIPWIYGHTMGLNFTNEKICQLFQRWDQEMHRIENFCSMGDDVIFTCLAWDLGFRPFFSLQDIVGFYDFPPPMGSFSSSLIFYQDNHRLLIRSGWGAVYD